MTFGPNSIFRAAFRSFLMTICIALGILVALLLLMLIVGLFGLTSESTFEHSYKVQVLPNADGKRKTLQSKTPLILQIDVTGVVGTPSLSMDTIDTILMESREGDLKDDRVKAILLFVNSPGGVVVDADSIYRALLLYKSRHQVPIYAYVDGLCASGAFYISLAADKIYSSEVSLIGSVGVIISTAFNVTNLLDNYGIKTLTLYEGKGKDELNPFRPWKPEEQVGIQDIIKYYYQRFVGLVVQHRPRMDKEKLVQVYGAHIFPAEIAKEHGYVDKADGSRDEALKDLALKAGIDADYQVVRLEKKNWITDFLSTESSLKEGTIKHQLQLDTLDPSLSGKFLYMYQP